MAQIEQYIVSLMQQMAKMHQPLNKSEGLSLANSLVEGTEWENKIVEFSPKEAGNPSQQMALKILFLVQHGIMVSGNAMVMKYKRKKDKSSPRIDLSGPSTETSCKCMMKCMKQWRKLELQEG